MNELITISKCKITPTSLEIQQNTTEDEWMAIGETLAIAEGAIQWWIGDRAAYGERVIHGKRSIAYDLLEEKIGLGRNAIKTAKWVADNVESSIPIDDLSWTHHREVADLEPEQQRHWLEQAVKNEWSVRDLKREMKKDKMLALPSDKYRIIYADPPWEYAIMQHSRKEQETTIETHYPTMSHDELCSMDIASICDDDAVLFMWTTSPKIHEAKEVMDAWGFEYKAQMIWDKVKHNVGNYFSVRHEILLLGTHGSCLPDNPKLYDSVQVIERTEHSAKPEEFRKIIDDLYPYGKRIELFARRSIPGWNVWGNEVD